MRQKQRYNHVFTWIVLAIIAIIIVVAIVFAFGSRNVETVEPQNLVFEGELEGSQEVPPTTSTAKGSATFMLSEDSKMATFNIDIKWLSGPISSATINLGDVGVEGPVINDITDDFVGNGHLDTAVANGIWYGSGSTPFTETLAERLQKGDLYIVINTGLYPNGEVRAQLIPSNV